MSAGSIRLMPSGKWQLRATAGIDPITGKRRVIVETVEGSKRTAELRLAELVGKAQRSAGASSTTAGTVADVVAAYLAQPRLAKGTRVKVAASVKHLPPRLANMKAEKLGARDLDLLYQALEQKGVGVPTIRSLHHSLATAYAQSVRWRVLDHNPLRSATPPPEGQTRSVGNVTDAQIEALLAQVAGDLQREVWLRLHLVTGARCAEVVAIRWSSLDGNRLTLDGQIERGADRRRKETKTKRSRHLALDAGTVEMIRKWKNAQRERALECGVALAADPYLLSADPSSAQPWAADQAGQRYRRIAKRAGVVGVRLHDLRHAAASYMLASGIDVVTVAARLGHANPRTTLTVYAHVLEGRDHGASDVLAARLA